MVTPATNACLLTTVNVFLAFESLCGAHNWSSFQKELIVQWRAAFTSLIILLFPPLSVDCLWTPLSKVNTCIDSFEAKQEHSLMQSPNQRHYFVGLPKRRSCTGWWMRQQLLCACNVTQIWVHHPVCSIDGENVNVSLCILTICYDSTQLCAIVARNRSSGWTLVGQVAYRISPTHGWVFICWPHDPL